MTHRGQQRSYNNDTDKISCKRLMSTEQRESNNMGIRYGNIYYIASHQRLTFELNFEWPLPPSHPEIEQQNIHTMYSVHQFSCERTNERIFGEEKWLETGWLFSLSCVCVGVWVNVCENSQNN